MLGMCLGYRHMSRLVYDEAKWITLHPNGKGVNSKGQDIKGSHVLIDSESGEILGGLGGKFTGRHISAVPKQGKNEQHNAQATIEYHKDKRKKQEQEALKQQEQAQKEQEEAQKKMEQEQKEAQQKANEQQAKEQEKSNNAKEQSNEGSNANSNELSIPSYQARIKEAQEAIKENPLPSSFSSAQEVTNYLQKLAPKIDFSTVADMRPDQAENVAKSFHRMYSTFPILNGMLESVNYDAKWYSKRTKRLKQRKKAKEVFQKFEREQHLNKTEAVTLNKAEQESVNAIKSDIEKAFESKEPNSKINGSDLYDVCIDYYRKSVAQANFTGYIFVDKLLDYGIEKYKDYSKEDALKLVEKNDPYFRKKLLRKFKQEHPEEAKDIFLDEVANRSRSRAYGHTKFPVPNAKEYEGTYASLSAPLLDKSEEDIQKEYKHQIELGHFQPLKEGVSPVESCLTHELAHVVDFATERRIHSNPVIKRAFFANQDTNPNAYASFNMLEFIAESISEAFHSPNPRPHTQEVLKALKEAQEYLGKFK